MTSKTLLVSIFIFVMIMQMFGVFVLMNFDSKSLNNIKSNDLKKLKDFINYMNNKEIVYNKNIFGDNYELVIVVQVHDRPLYLQQLLNSLKAASFINSTLLIFSHDLVDYEINDLIQNINFAKFMQIFFPYSKQIHPNSFPGPDSTKCDSFNEHCTRAKYSYRNSSLTQIKHHWWWKANFIFKKLKILENFNGLVLFLEEDQYLAPDFIYCLKLMQEHSEEDCENCWFYSLGFYKNMDFEGSSNFAKIMNTLETVGLAFNRTIWEKIDKYRNFFCYYNDYNWDFSLKHLYQKIPEDKRSFVLQTSRVLHIGLCGIHTTTANCNPKKIIDVFKERHIRLYPLSLHVFSENMSPKFKPYGGWEDERDYELCMKQ